MAQETTAAAKFRQYGYPCPCGRQRRAVNPAPGLLAKLRGTGVPRARTHQPLVRLVRLVRRDDGIATRRTALRATRPYLILVTFKFILITGDDESTPGYDRTYLHTVMCLEPVMVAIHRTDASRARAAETVAAGATPHCLTALTQHVAAYLLCQLGGNASPSESVRKAQRLMCTRSYRKPK
eukprot:6180988-Pleurochrysis_carterae.AAC.1